MGKKTARHLKDNFLRSITPPEERQEIYDGGCAGLVARVEPSGTITWTFRFRNHLGKKGTMKLGTYRRAGSKAVEMSLAHARRRVVELREMILKGVDPKDPDPRPAQAPNTLGAMIDRWVKEEASRNRSQKTQERYLRQFPEAWRRLDPNKLTAGHVREWHLRKGDDPPHGEGSPYAANRCVMTLRSVYRWALRFEWVEKNPCDNIEPMPEAPRDRALSLEEIRVLWMECEARADSASRIVQLCLLTGCRPGEWMNARWDEIDFDERELVLTPTRHKTGRKTRKNHHVHLTETAWNILQDLPSRWRGEDCLFPGKLGDKPLTTIKTARRTLAEGAALRLAKAKGVDVPKAKGDRKRVLDRVMPPWQLRDLRATWATQALALGVGGLYVSLCLNHANPSVDRLEDRMAGVTRRHYHRGTNRDGMREAWKAWDQRLQALVSTEGGKLLGWKEAG